MKKIVLLALGACMFVATADAQFKQAGGEKNLQVLFAPLGGNPISINGISFRKFNATGDAAWRLNLFIGLNNSTDVLSQPIDTGTFTGGGAVPQADERSSGMTISLRPGYEKHMPGTDRLSPYWGAEILFSMTTSTTETDHVDFADYTNTPAAWQVYTTEKKGDGASTTFGLNLIAGCDFFIAKNLHMGAEFGFGFATTSMPDIEDQRVLVTTTTSGSNTTVTHTIQDLRKEVQGKSMQVGPNVVGQFKLGWLF